MLVAQLASYPDDPSSLYSSSTSVKDRLDSSSSPEIVDDVLGADTSIPLFDLAVTDFSTPAQLGGSPPVVIKVTRFLLEPFTFLGMLPILLAKSYLFLWKRG
jgi:hypothetical protein